VGPLEDMTGGWPLLDVLGPSRPFSRAQTPLLSNLGRTYGDEGPCGRVGWGSQCVMSLSPLSWLPWQCNDPAAKEKFQQVRV
jgi:hypothetical protein